MNDDRRLADLIGENLKPRPLGRTAQVAFRRAVEERIESRSAPRWIGGLALAATAATAAALWLANPIADEIRAPEIARHEEPGAAPELVPNEVAAVPETPEAAVEEDETVLASFADPDEVVDDAGASEDYLPDDYVVLASVVDAMGG